jgi:hypothetical protein
MLPGDPANGAGGEDGVTMVRRVLRLEGAAIGAAAVAGYAWLGGPWWVFALLFLAPDLAMLGYLAGPRVGSVAYDAVHTVALPVPLLAIGVLGGHDRAVAVALIWLAHIGFDRALGYGLKYATGFKDTHLQRV